MSLYDIDQSRSLDKPLFHYTSVDSLDKIIGSNCLLASSVSYMNDSSEFEYALKLTCNVLKKKASGESEPLTSILYESLLETFAKYTDTIVPLFIVSFSEEQNSLSQWRSYTPYGKGVSIEFKPDRIKEHVKRNSLQLVRCIYDWPEQERQISRNLDSAIGQAMKVIGSIILAEDDEGKAIVKDALGRCAWDFLETLGNIKHPDFKEEREWRIISQLIPWSTGGLINYRNKSGIYVPYIEVNFDKTPIFDSVVLGPTAHEKLALFSMEEHLVKKLGVTPKVEWCGTPYREWT